MSFLKEFREFAMRGNVVDMAVGVIIGGAFGKIVSSLVGDVVMPVLGILVAIPSMMFYNGLGRKVEVNLLKWKVLNAQKDKE